jgi:hydroxypyruvate isomerase
VIAAAAEIGYAAVELWDRFQQPFDAILEAAGENGLTVASMNGHSPLTDGLNRRANHDRLRDEILASIETAQAEGIPNLICFSGNRYEGVSDEEAIGITAEGLDLVKAAAEDAGVTLVLELLNSKVNHPGYQCDHTAWGVSVIEKVGSPNVKLLYDIYHMQIMEGDLIRTIKDAVAHIGHFHTAGNPGRRDLDDAQEINYKAVMDAIASTDYAGFVAHEFTPKADKVAALEAAFKLCER